MGDRLHKNAPPDELEDEDATDDFVEDARAALARNKEINRISGASEGHHAYLIDTRAALARALSERLGRVISEKMISNLIGPARENSNWDRVHRSAYVRPIRQLLGLRGIVAIEVPARRAALLSRISKIDEKSFDELEDALNKSLLKVLPKK